HLADIQDDRLREALGTLSQMTQKLKRLEVLESELESALASKRRADEKNQLLEKALQTSSHAEGLVADEQRQNAKLRSRFEEECAQLRRQHSEVIQTSEEDAAQRLLEAQALQAERAAMASEYHAQAEEQQ
ncbi:unnamed protein product, partial [Symbiodinium pilosum]